MVVAYDDGVDDGYIFDLAGHLGVAFWTKPAEGRAAVLEDWVEEHAHTVRELDVVAGVAEPCCSKLADWIFPRWEEHRLDNRNCRRCSIWLVGHS